MRQRFIHNRIPVTTRRKIRREEEFEIEVELETDKQQHRAQILTIDFKGNK